MSSCKEFFAEHEFNGDRCKLLQKREHEELLRWESESASDKSPGPVQNDECLYRQFMNPTHYDSTNNILKATAFSDTSDKGGSVNRKRLITHAEAVQAAEDRAKQMTAKKQDGTKVELWNLVELETAQVRSIMSPAQPGTEPRRGFAVYDTALPHDPSHADICQIVSGKETGRSVRSKLLDLANDFLKSKQRPECKLS